MLLSFVRTFILYIVVVAALRLMGKRQIGEMQPSELVVAIMISELATLPMESVDIPIINGIVPVITLVIAEVVFSFITLKSERLRSIMTGTPSVVMRGGVVDEDELKRLRFTMDDLQEELRMGGYPDISQVESAVLENNGQISIIPKSKFRPVTPEDLNLNPPQENLPYVLISDGVLHDKNINEANVTLEWLNTRLKKYNVTDYKNVLLASVNEKKELFIQIKEGANK